MSSLPHMDAEILQVLLRFFRGGNAVALRDGRLHLATDLEYLRLQWALSTPVDDLVRYLIEKRHEAQASFEPVLRDGTATVRGRLVPVRTIIRRRVTGDVSQVSYLEPRKSFTEGPNHVLGWVLRFCHHLLQRYVQMLSGSPHYSQRVHRIFRQIGSVLHIKGVGDALDGVNLRVRPSAKSVTQAGESRKALYRSAFAAYQILTRIESGDVEATVGLLNGSLIGPLEEWQRFELLLALRMSECMAKALGLPLVLQPIRQGANQPIATFGDYDTYWQSRTPYSQFPLLEPSEAVVHQILKSYKVPVGSDRPDVVICERTRRIVVALGEAKFSASQTAGWADQFRDAATQLVRYSRLYEHICPQDELLRRSLLAVSNLAPEIALLPTPATSPMAVSMAGLLESKLANWVDRVVRAVTPEASEDVREEDA